MHGIKASTNPRTVNQQHDANVITSNNEEEEDNNKYSTVVVDQKEDEEDFTQIYATGTDIMRREEEEQQNIQYNEDHEEDEYCINEVDNMDDRSNVSNSSLPSLRARDRVNHMPILIYGGEAGEDDEEEEKSMNSSSNNDIITTARSEESSHGSDEDCDINSTNSRTSITRSHYQFAFSNTSISCV